MRDSKIKPLLRKRWKDVGLDPAEYARAFDAIVGIGPIPSLIIFATDDELTDWCIEGVQIIERLTRSRGKPSVEKTRTHWLRLIKDAAHRDTSPPKTKREFLERAIKNIAYDVFALLPRPRGRASTWGGVGIIRRAMYEWPTPREVVVLAQQAKAENPKLQDVAAISSALHKLGITNLPPDHVFTSYRKRLSDMKRSRRR